jgi:cell filamentation protein
MQKQNSDTMAYLSAIERSSVNNLEIHELLRQALTDKIADHEVFMKGIEQLYYYEEPNLYR